ncbi:thiol-disulfide oxidoreductase DCC family protein [Cognatitamlana onchidii]|uniref:thiol-disulfide oxidoreductase DCC family protein n=1 Tax=Cognatitamlana onchidii TaxID=2562860 RepID=UPI0010A5C42F|nr:thiol-disulfide oxidoreductase DCC family protein [Algibacter onchidii]
MKIDIEKDKHLVLFDGVCNLCNSSIQFIIKHDKQQHFRFAPLQGKTGQALIKTFNIDTAKTDSILLYSPKTNDITYKSSAALKIAQNLNFPINMLAVFLILPAFLRNVVYDFIAKNRYKWFGKKESCMIPTPELTSKFLD